MSVLIHLRGRPDTLYASRGRTSLACGLDGDVLQDAHGLFVHETRVLSRHRLLVNGASPYPVTLSNVQQHSWLGYYIVGAPGRDHEPPDMGSGMLADISQQTVEIRVSRSVGEGLHEDLDLTNFTQQRVELDLELELDADFADLIEAGRRHLQIGEVSASDWTSVANGWQREYVFRAERQIDVPGERGTARLERSAVFRIDRASTAPDLIRDRVRFHVTLDPQGSWHACLRISARMNGQELTPPMTCRALGPDPAEPQRSEFLGTATRFAAPETSTMACTVITTLEQAKSDLAALRLPDLDHGPDAWTMAAGHPLYVALFGRDVLTTSWQAAITGPEMMRGSLLELARWQGRTTNAWRDEQPGRMLHEAHTGPLEALNENPRGRSYGSITTSAFYPVVLASLWHWTGDRTIVDELLRPAIDAVAWLDRSCGVGAKGFYSYLTRSSQGVEHQAWKDSADAIVDRHGRQVAPPIATCEEQAFAYTAKVMLAEMLLWTGRRDEARHLFRQARDLKARFNDAFWMEDAGFYALGLDRQGRRIDAIASNPGHCLAAAIVDSSLARRTADRLMLEDLFSGWGIRTLSMWNPAFNPYSYHRGSVWPVEQATFVLGFVRFGLHHHAHRLTRSLFEAARIFEACRLPELFAGHARDADHPFPALYPQANSPQAWSSSAPLQMVQSLLGVYPYAPLHLLFVDPHLPEWLPELDVSDLRVGEARVSLHFFRKQDGSTDYRVQQLEGRLHVIRQPSPWSLTADRGERLMDVLSSFTHTPRRHRHASR
jgi:glycogen debranching enzyme